MNVGKIVAYDDLKSVLSIQTTMKNLNDDLVTQ